MEEGDADLAKNGSKMENQIFQNGKRAATNNIWTKKINKIHGGLERGVSTKRQRELHGKNESISLLERLMEEGEMITIILIIIIITELVIIGLGISTIRVLRKLKVGKGE